MSEIEYVQTYSLLNLIGQSQTIQTYSAIDHKTNEKIAIKQIYAHQYMLDQITSRISEMRMLESDHIVSLKHMFYEPQQLTLNIVIELCEGSIFNKKFQTQKELLSLLVQITNAFLQIESKRISYLLTGPSKILIANEKKNIYKLTNFCCSQFYEINFDKGFQQFYRSVSYIAPEIRNNYKTETSQSLSNIWSLGTILYQMIFGKLPFLRRDIFNDKYVIDYESTTFAPIKIINVVKLMLRPIPTDRITWKQLKQYLIKELNVEDDQFMNIKDLIQNFNKIIELLIKTANTMKAGIDKAAPFWNVQKSTKLQTYETLVHYIYLNTIKFLQRHQYKWHLAPPDSRLIAEQLIKQAGKLEQAVCKQKDIQELETKDFNYIEIKLMDSFQELKRSLSRQKGELEFIHAVCNAVATIIRKSEGLFKSLVPFKKCFEIEI